MVYWSSIRQVIHEIRLAPFCQTSKIMCGWLLTNYIQGYTIGVIGCTGCGYQKETLDHVLRCPNKEANEATKTALIAFRKEGRKKRITQQVVDKTPHTKHVLHARVRLKHSNHP